MKKLFFLAFLFFNVQSQNCITGSSVDVQNALNTTGEARLCQGAKINILTPIIMPNNSKIYTDGLPADNALKATLFLPNNSTITTPLLQAYLSQVEIKNIIFDGNRANNVYSYSRVLATVGGSNSIIDNNYFTNTTGLGSLILADNPNCENLQVTNNYVYNAGIHEGPPNQWADGITIRCRDSIVQNNIVQNATDGGITVMSSPGTIISDNLIINNERSAFSGLLFDPVMGADFTGTIAENNTIIVSNNQHVHLALGVGTHLWCDPTQNNGNCQSGTGAIARNNIIQTMGGKFGFGLVVSGMQNATVENNVWVNWQGWGVQNCRVVNQVRYVIDNTFASGVFQSGYSERGPFYWPCIGPIQ